MVSLSSHSLAALLAAVVLLSTSACGSSKPKTDDTSSDNGVAAETDAQVAETPEQKFDRQRVDTTGKMCERLIDCSLTDAKKTMTPEELEQIERENVAEMALEDCSRQYGGMALSPRQVIGIRGCLAEATECPAFNECLVTATSGAEE